MLRVAAAVALAALTPNGAAGANVPAACLSEIVSADYTSPTHRYAHGVFGETEEWGALSVDVALAQTCRAGFARLAVVLPDDMVFEDIAPRLADVDHAGGPEIVVVETHVAQGARLAVWGLTDRGFVRRAATPFIGHTHRWLAPAAIGDLDGDGAVEIAYVDRPHLAKILRVWRWTGEGLREVASLAGVTNHRLGAPEIEGGLRDCGAGPELILADASWQRIVAVRFGESGLTLHDLASYSGGNMTRALGCDTR